MEEYHQICRLDASTDLLYAAAAAECGGLVSSRDFCQIRSVAVQPCPKSIARTLSKGQQEKNPCYICGGVGVKLASIGPRPGRVRGWNGVTGFVIIPTTQSGPLLSPPPRRRSRSRSGSSSSFASRESCRVVWVIHSDLKGWLSPRLIELAITSVIEKLFATLRSKLEA